MKRGSLLLLGLTLIFFLVGGSVFADDATQRIETIVIDGFDGPGEFEWRAFGSKFSTEGYPQYTYAEGIYPDDLYGREDVEGTGLQSFGVHAQYDRMGYNYIEIVPGQVGQDGDWAAEPVPLPGRVDTIDFWVWGSNYYFYLELYIMDANGYVHKFEVDDLDFIGWRNLFVDIPPSVPQSRVHVPRYTGLRITKFVLWTRPNVPVNDFYFYLDNLKVMTDMHESRFDGFELADPEVLNEIWGGEE